MLYVWVAIIILLTLLEMLTINLTTIWYVAGAVVALILSLFIDNFFIQFGAFVVVGTILLITTRPLLEKLVGINKEKTNLDRIIGMTGVVTSDIKKNNIGEVKVDGKRWSAISDKSIKADSIVKILEIDGVKLKVEKSEE